MMREITVLHYPEIATPNWALLEEAAKRRAIRLASWQPHLLQIQCSGTTCRPYYDGSAAIPDIVLHRTVSRFAGLTVPALTMWSQLGASVINDPLAAYQSRDKLATTIVLCRSGVPIVATLGVDRSSPAPAFGVGDDWVVVKPAHGVRGEGIEAFGSVYDIPVGMPPTPDPPPSQSYCVREHFVVQPLIGGGGRDVRAYVVGGECVAIMQRQALPGEVRANIALGGTGLRLPLDHPAAKVAVAAMAACGLDIGGVDLIEEGTYRGGEPHLSDAGVRVLEVDAWAGFAGITAVTGVDVAGRILDLALTRRDGRGS